jgi:hypothetical protein
MGSFLRIVILNFHRSISGITGLPVKNPKKIGSLSFFLAVGCRNRLGISCFVKKWQGGKEWGDLKKSNLSIFSKMKVKFNVCSNLTTQTSKYRLDVSQLSHQCFTGFPLSLLSKKSKHFFRKCFQK